LGAELRRHHPADALARRLLLAVIGAKVSSTPSAGGAAATGFNISKDLINSEASNWQRALMMTGPIAFALAEAINQQLANAM